jgi:DinB superfamily
MPISIAEEVLDQLESHWVHQLRPRLDGLTDEEYIWEPVPACWSVRPRRQVPAALAHGSGEYVWEHGPTQGPEPLTTLAWRIGHLAEGLASTAGTWFGGPSVDLDSYDYAGTASTALAQLDREYAAFVAGVRALGDGGLAEPQGDRSPPAYAHAPVARVVMYTSVEVFHHGAEACLLRDLYLRR